MDNNFVPYICWIISTNIKQKQNCTNTTLILNFLTNFKNASWVKICNFWTNQSMRVQHIKNKQATKTGKALRHFRFQFHFNFFYFRLNFHYILVCIFTAIWICIVHLCFHLRLQFRPCILISPLIYIWWHAVLSCCYIIF